jgi:hypothetical protein
LLGRSHEIIASTGAKTRKAAKSECESPGLTSPYFCSRFVSRETPGVKPLIKNPFRFTAPSRPRPATDATARLQVQTPTCFDHFFTQKRKKHANLIKFSESVSTKD